MLNLGLRVKTREIKEEGLESLKITISDRVFIMIMDNSNYINVHF